MRSLFNQIKRVFAVFSFCCILLLNIVIQSPKFLVSRQDYDNMMQLCEIYKVANLTVNVERPFYNLALLANETAKYYFYTVNSPKKKDIAKLDALRAVAPYWGQYVWENDILSGISLSMQNMNNNPSSSAMKLLDYTDTKSAMFRIDMYDACFSVRFKDSTFYIIMQLLGALAGVSILYLFVYSAQRRYEEEDDYYEDEYDEMYQDSNQEIDYDTMVEDEVEQAEESLSNNVKEIITGDREYFTRL